MVIAKNNSEKLLVLEQEKYEKDCNKNILTKGNLPTG